MKIGGAATPGFAMIMGMVLVSASLTGCDGESDGSDTPAVETNATTAAASDSGGGSRSHAYIALTRDRGMQTTVRLKPGVYEATLECTNDGDPDVITIAINGQIVLSYTTKPNRFGGNGWYVPQVATSRPFRIDDSEVAVKVGVRAGPDGYGVWPQTLDIRKVD